MILLTFAMMHAAYGLSDSPPRAERLQFIFARGDQGGRPAVGQGGPPKIAGSLSTPTQWSGPAFFNIVQQCGGKRLSVARSVGYRVVVTGESNADNLDVARCVQASTSVGFWAGVRESGDGAMAFDQRPFEALWSR
jgi:hypothetical protein